MHRLILVLDKLALGIRLVNRYMLYLGVMLLIIIVVCAVYGVVQRSIGRPVSWPLELTELLQVAFAFLPTAYALNQGKHVSLELVNNMFGEYWRRFARSVVSVGGALTCFLMVYATLGGAMSSFFMREASVVVSLPIYPFKFCVVAGFLLLGLQFLGHFWETIRGAEWAVKKIPMADTAS